MKMTVNLHPDSFAAELFEPGRHHGGFATVKVNCGDGNQASIFLDEAKADELIKAACAAKDMLHAAKHAAVMAPAFSGLPVLDGEGGEDALDPAPEAGVAEGAPIVVTRDELTAEWDRLHGIPNPVNEEHHLASLRDRDHYTAPAGPFGPGNPDPACDSPEPASYADGHCRCMICGRCGHHTGNSHQGHYWAFCVVTGTMRDFHFCCPGNCELKATTAAEVTKDVTSITEIPVIADAMAAKEQQA